MFIYNLKLNGKKITKITFIIIAIVITIFFISSAYKIYRGTFKVKDENKKNVCYIDTKNYTNILKCVHDDLDSYEGKKICFSGYVYRLNDFEDNNFVLARDMIISSDMQTLIVGFLCDYKNANQFENETWIEITGEITKGNYNGDIPVLKITDIKKINKPVDDIYVYPPDDNYVPTSVIF